MSLSFTEHEEDVDSVPSNIHLQRMTFTQIPTTKDLSLPFLIYNLILAFLAPYNVKFFQEVLWTQAKTDSKESLGNTHTKREVEGGRVYL